MELSPASPNISYVVVQTSRDELDGPPYEFVSRATAEAHLTADGSMPIVWQRMVERTLVSDDTSIFGPDGYQHPRLQGRVGTAGAELNLSSLTLTSGNTQAVNYVNIGLPG